MLLTDKEGRARWRRVQPAVIPHQPGAKRGNRAAAVGLHPGATLGLGLVLMLGGCSNLPGRDDPVTWWHHLEGGAIAQNRPPPPNPNAPFPKIADQPTRPAGMPDWEWNQLSATLASQRAEAQAYAAQNPIPTLAQPPAAPAAMHRPAPARALPPPVPSPAASSATPPADTGQSAATVAEIQRLAAAPGPAGSAAPPPSAAAVATATANAANPSGASSLTFQGPSASSHTSGPRSVPVDAGSPTASAAAAATHVSYFDPTNGLSIPGALSPVEQPDEAHPPPVPASVPVPPTVPGFAIPAVPSTYVAPVPLPEPAPYVPPAPLPPVAPVPIQFAPHSAVLTPPMQQVLLHLIQAGAGARIAVTGFGDARSDSITEQAAAMPLALERARAIVVQLMTYGFTAHGISAGARALGSGGLAQLTD